MSSRTGNSGSKDQEGAHSSCSCQKAKEHTPVVPAIKKRSTLQ